MTKAFIPKGWTRAVGESLTRVLCNDDSQVVPIEATRKSYAGESCGVRVAVQAVA
jgi:hypothetical protein